MQPRTVLDVGAGRGKGGILIPELIGRTTGAPPNGPIECIDAVEIEPSYITRTLDALYDTVFLADVRRWTYDDFEPYDLVTMVDVIEHMPKPDALEVLRRIPGHVVVSTPEEFFSNGEGLAPSEEHVSVWSREDFAGVRRIDKDVSQQGGIILRLAPLVE